MFRDALRNNLAPLGKTLGRKSYYKVRISHINNFAGGPFRPIQYLIDEITWRKVSPEVDYLSLRATGPVFKRPQISLNLR